MASRKASRRRGSSNPFGSGSVSGARLELPDDDPQLLAETVVLDRGELDEVL
jgi:hypothetical protein